MLSTVNTNKTRNCEKYIDNKRKGSNYVYKEKKEVLVQRTSQKCAPQEASSSREALRYDRAQDPLMQINVALSCFQVGKSHCQKLLYSAVNKSTKKPRGTWRSH